MRRLKENTVVFTEIILLTLLIALVIWIGVGETTNESLKVVQGLLFILNFIALIVGPFVVVYIEGRPSKASKERMKQLKLEKSKKH